jgi:hypothetical protein
MSVKTLSRRALVLAAGALVVPLALTSQGSAAASRKAVAHGANGKSVHATHAPTPKMYRLGHGAGEPTIGITRRGKVFFTASSGCVTSCAGSTESLQTVSPGGRAVYMTDNKGKSWKNVSPGDPGTGVSPHAFSMDPYMFVDQTPDGSRVFNVDLTVACSELSYSDDGGSSWTTSPVACGEPVNDHQTVFSGKPVTSPTVGYPKIIYYCFNHPAFTKCSKSLNGGLTFIPTAQINNPSCSGLNGHGVTSSKGVVYIPLGNCGKPKLAISSDEGDNWKVIDIASEMSVAGGDPSLAIDAKNNLYYTWVDGDDRLPFMSTSTNGGKTWSKPVMIAAPGVKGTNLVTMTVGAPGMVAFAYYGTTEDPADKQSRWSGYIASATGVLGKKAIYYSATVNPASQPFKVNGCGPGRCGRVLDFIDVEIAPDGQPWAVYVDACQATCEKTGTESIHDNEGVVGTLVGGPKLR